VDSVVSVERHSERIMVLKMVLGGERSSASVVTNTFVTNPTI